MTPERLRAFYAAHRRARPPLQSDPLCGPTLTLPTMQASASPARSAAVTVCATEPCSLALLASLAGRSWQLAIVNAANNEVPGGGVSFGASAQEEALCRHTTLLPSLEGVRKAAYPLSPTDLSPLGKVLLTPCVRWLCPPDSRRSGSGPPSYLDHRIVRAYEQAPAPTQARWFVPDGPGFAVVSVAAPARSRHGSVDPAEVQAVMHVRFVAMWQAVAASRATHLVLPIPGCGCFAVGPDGRVDEAFVRAIVAALVASLASAPAVMVLIPSMGPEVHAALVAASQRRPAGRRFVFA